MGFWDITKRMLQGKPAFEVPPPEKEDEDWGDGSSRTEPVAASNGTDTLRRDGSGNKILPEAWVGRCKYHLSGTRMQVHAPIRNQSQLPIFLDKIQLINQTRELDYLLQPGESREFCIFDGPAPTTGAYTEANLYYRDNGSGDYFMARHYIEYHLQNNLYCVEQLHPEQPVVDI